MPTEVWIIVTTVAATITAIIALLLFIHWAVVRSVRGEIGATLGPILELTAQASHLVDQARSTQQEMHAQLLKVTDQFEEQRDKQHADISNFASACETKFLEMTKRVEVRSADALAVVSEALDEASRIVDDLRCKREELLLEQEIDAILSRIAASVRHAAGGSSRLRFGRITSDNPFLDYVVKVECGSPRYLSIQIKALGDYQAADALRCAIERATSIQNTPPAEGLIRSVIVVNRLPDCPDVIDQLAGMPADNAVEVVPIDEFLSYARSWVIRAIVASRQEVEAHDSSE